MTLLQALLIALFGYLSSNYSPWCFGQLGGWYTMGRPLVSGLIIGVILGDVRTGILMGAAVQTLYIGLVTPGLSMPADLNFAAYMGIPLAMVAGASTEYALSLSVPLSFLGRFVSLCRGFSQRLLVRKQEQMVEQRGRFKKATNVPGICVDIPVCGSFCTDFSGLLFRSGLHYLRGSGDPGLAGRYVCGIFWQDAAGGRFCDAAAICAG